MLLTALATGWGRTEAWAAKTWTGLGDGTSWNNAANWSGGLVPSAADEVLLDQSGIAGSYVVALPPGAVTVTVLRLTIAPGPNRIIEVSLPASNTANPGLRVGDGLAGTDDIILSAGALLSNRSGASFGGGIEVTSSLNGTVRINNGGRYLHATQRSTSGIAPFLSLAAGTESGVFEYDVPGTAAFNIAASGRTYGSLTLSRSSGSGAYGALGTSALTVRGEFKVGNGAAFTPSMTGALVLFGAVTNLGNTMTIPAVMPVVFNGSGVQTLSGAGAMLLGGASTVSSGATLAVAGTLTNLGTMTIQGALQVEPTGTPGGTGVYAYDGGSLVIKTLATTRSVGAVGYWPSVSRPAQVWVQGSGGITLTAARDVDGTLRMWGPVNGGSLLTVSGRAELETGGAFGSSPQYSGEGTLVYRSTRSVGAEWIEGTTVGVGVPKHVMVESGVVQMPSTTRSVVGNLTVQGGTLALDMDLGDVPVRGDLVMDLGGAITDGAVTMMGSAVQQVRGAAEVSLERLRLLKTGGSVGLWSDLTLSGSLGGATLEFNGSSDVLDLRDHRLSLSGYVGGQNANGSLRGGPAAKLSLEGPGAVGTLRFASGAQELAELSMDRSGSGGGVTLASSLTVGQTIVINSGVLKTGLNELRLAAGGQLVRGTGYVEGWLRKTVEPGTLTTAFEVGSGGVYAPFEVTWNTVTGQGELALTTIATDYVGLATSGIDSLRSVNRHWRSSSTGVVFDSCHVRLTYGASEVDALAQSGTLVVENRVAGSWLEQPVGTRTATTIEARSVTSIGDFAIGNLRSYPLSIQVAGTGSVTRTPDLPLYTHASLVQLTAVPGLRFRFVSWSGDATGSTNPVIVQMNQARSVTATFELESAFTWTGAGDGTSWNDSANWASGSVPNANHDVLLDQSGVAGNYTVTLPGGATGVQVGSLRITPGAGRTITVVLPATNTADPGLRIGDALLETEDLVISTGGVLRNASGAASGSGVGLYTAAEGIARLDAGGRYIHATSLNPLPIVSRLSTVTGTETGVFEYDVPGTGTFNISAAGETYGSLTLSRSSGSGTYGALGASALTVRGELKVGSGVAFAPSMTGALALYGAVTNLGSSMVIPAGMPVAFNGTGVQTLSGSGAMSMAGSSTVSSSATLALTGTLTNLGTMTIQGALQVEPSGTPGGSGVYAYDGGNLVFKTYSTNRSVGAAGYWPAVSGPAEVWVQGSGGITLTTAREVDGALRMWGPVNGGSLLTLSGRAELETGGVFGAAPQYAGEGTLVYRSTRSVGAEWNEGTTVGVGVPKHVTVESGVVQMPPAQFTVPGDLTLEGGTLALDIDLGDVAVRGDLVMDMGGAVTNGAVTLSGASGQRIRGGTQVSLERLRLAKTGGAVELWSDLTLGGSLGGATLEFNGSSDELDLRDHRMTLGGSLGGLNGNGVIRGGPSAKLTLDGPGAAGVIRFASGAQQLAELVVNRSGSGAGVILGTGLTVTGTLDLTDGVVSTDPNELQVAAGGQVVRGAGYVEGWLRKTVGVGAPTTVFEVGSGGVYAPFEVTWNGVSGEGELAVTTIASDYVGLAGSGLDSLRSVNRYWQAMNGGVVFDSCRVKLRFAASDVDPGATPSIFQMVRRSGGLWGQELAGTRAATSIEASRILGFGDFAVGERDRFSLTVLVPRPERYSLEVSFPSPSGSRVILDASSHPELGNLDPREIPGRTLTVYRDGRVLGLEPGMAARGFSFTSGATRMHPRPGMDLSTESVGSRARLHLGASFTESNPGFTVYPGGTVAPAWGDYDNDGDLDLPLFRNDGGTFSEIPGFAGHLQGGNYHGSAWCDYDKDGDRDLVILSYTFAGTATTHTVLLRNNGGGSFTNIAPSLGLDFVSRGETAIWADFNLDGWPDLFAPYYSHVIPYDTYFFMYFNDGMGGFVDVSDSAGVSATNRFVEGVDVADWENDGDLDLYFSSRIYLNDGSGHFADASAQIGLPDRFDEGGSFVDYDNDGDLDVYVRNGDTARLFRNDNGSLTDVTNVAGIPATGLSWGDAWADADNDGDVDFLYHYRTENTHLMVNQGNGTFVSDPGFQQLNLIGAMAAWADYDKDGDMDFVEGAPPSALFQNQLQAQPGFEDSYLRVRVLDGQGFENEKGAMLRLRPVNGPVGVVQTRVVGGGSSYLSQNEYTTHFGLGVPGTVAVSPAQADYQPGAPVQLVATPSTGYTFVSWGGDVSGSANPLNVTMTTNINITAQFQLVSHFVTANAGVGGSVSRSPDQPTYPYGSRVHLTATPSGGYSFVGWSGDGSGSANPLVVPVDGNKSITATFALNAYTLSVTAAGDGSVSRVPDQASYTHGTLVQLTANPGLGSHFVSWSGSVTSTTNPLTVLMDGNKSVTATFGINTYTLGLTTVGSGLVTKNPDLAEYPHGTLVNLNATPSPGWRFVAWSGDAQGTEGPLSVIMDRNRSVTATFAINAFAVNVTTIGNGTVVKSPNQPTYDYGTQVTLTATPSVNNAFVGWSGDTTGTASPITFTVTGAKNVTASFTHLLTVNVAGTGSVSKSPDQPNYAPGATVTLTATPSPGHGFVGWSGDATGGTNPLPLLMNGNKTVTATFAINTYALSVTAVGSGSVVKNPDQAGYNHGSSVTLTAVPANGHQFVGWSGDTTGTANPVVLFMNSPKTVTATFAIKTYTLSAISAGNGSVVKSPDLALYNHGTSVTLTATANSGYHFEGWSGDTTTTTNPLDLIVVKNRSLTATFALNLPKTWLGASGGGDGTSWSVAANWSGGTVPSASDSVRLDNTTVTGNYTVNLPTGAVTTTINRLVIAPAASRTITLTLPATNTANPGLLVGDGAPGTEDIVLRSGATLRNASGAAAGTGLQLASTGNGQIVILDGARYIHATLRSPNAIAQRLSVGAGSETGEFQYDVPGTASFAIYSSAATYGTLTLTRTAGAAVYTASGATALTVRGHLRTSTGVTLTSTMTGALQLYGDLVANGASFSLPSSQAISFLGDTLQSVNGTASVTIAGAGTIAAASTVACGTAAFTVNGTLAVNGRLRVVGTNQPAGSGTYTYNATTGWLEFAHPTSTLTVNAPLWPATAGPQNLRVAGPAGVLVGAARSVAGTVQVAALLSRAERLTLSGTLEISPGASLPNAPIYAGTPTLAYKGTATVGTEWGAGTAVGSGVPHHVVIDAGAGTVTLPSTDRNVVGNLTVNSGTLALNATAGNLLLRGNLVSAATITTNGRALVFTGNAAQTLQGPAGMSLGLLRLTKTGGSVQLLSNLTLGPSGGSALDFTGTSDVLDLNGTTLTIGGTVSGADGNSVVKGSGSSSLVVQGSGAAGTIRFQTGAETLADFTINRSASGSVTLGSSLLVLGALGLQQGRLVTGTNVVTLSPSGAIVRTNGFIDGNLRKSVATGATLAYFEVGTGSVFSPVLVEFGNVATGGSLTAASLSGDHPQVATSGLNPARTVNRYWSLVNEGIVFDDYDATYTFAASDLDPSTDVNQLVIRKYNAPNWTVLQPGTRTATSTQATGITSFSDFAIGAIQTYTLNVTPVGNGSVSKSPDQPIYDSGTSVTLTATPLPGHTFVSWGGDASGSTNPLPLVMNANKNIVANFTFSLTTATVGTGTVSKSPNQTTYAPGTAVTLTANPGTGQHFVAWSGDTVATANPLAIVADRNWSVTATFEINTYTLNLASLGNGSAVKSPDQPTYTHGTTVTLTATPSGGHTFVGWSGSASGSTNPLPLLMNGNKTVTARFTFGLTVNTVGNGTVTKSPDQTTYAPGTSITLTAIPAPGYHLVSWTGDTTSTANPLVVVADRNWNVTATFAINTYTLSITPVGNGTVTKSPDQPSYNHGSTVTLTPVPAAGYHFVSWSGDTSGTTSPLTVVMTRNRAITATFAINTYTVSATPIGSGTISKTPNLAAYDHGASVSLTALPASGYHFVSWGGDTSGTVSPLSMIVTRNRAVTGTFAINTYTLDVTSVGNGSVVKNPSQATYDHGVTVTLTPTPQSGYHFVSWSGDTSGTADPMTVVMTRNRSITATFAINTYTLSATPVGTGTVVKNPNQASYNHGSTVLLTANPGTGYHFVSWGGDTSSTANPLTVVMTRNRSVTATFAINTYTADVTVVGSGSIVKAPNQATYDYGSTLSLTATPITGFHFVGWSGDTTTTGNPLNLVMTRNWSVTATFAINTYTLGVAVAGSGIVAKSPDQATYNHGTSVTLTATPGPGQSFLGWSGDATGATNPTSVLMNADKNVTATFTFPLSVSVVGSGSVNRSPDQPNYAPGTSVTLTAVPAPGYHFVAWSGDASGTTNPVVIVVSAARSVTATFAINTYTLDATASGNGSVVRAPSQAAYDHGTTVTVTATPGSGHHFVAWGGDTSGTANPLTVVMTRNRSIIGTFAINTYALSVSSVGSGSVAKSPDQPSYDHGTTVTLTATPAVGHHFVSWSGDATGGVNPTTVLMNAAKSVTATFAINTYALGVTTVGSGSVDQSPNQPSYDHGTTVTLTATPAAGHHFVSWSGAATGSVNPTTVLMDGPKSVTATFAINTYALSTVIVGSGSVAKSPDQPSYDHGTTVTLTATPGVGYHFSSWSGDATGSVSPTTVLMNGAKSVTATFAINTYALSVFTTGSGSVDRSPDLSSYDHGTWVTLTATPAVGHHFVSWSGDLTGAANPDSVLMDGAKSVTATFQIGSYALDVTVVGSGTVGKSPDQPAYEHGSSVTLTATPAVGYHFVSWSGDATGSVNPKSVLMDSPKSVTATFAINTYTLAVSVTGPGNLLVAPDQPTYNHGTSVTLLVTAGNGYHFVGWGGDTSGTENPLTIVMTRNRNITALIAINTYTLAVNTVGGGSVAKSPDLANYNHGSSVTLTPQPAVGYEFVGWSGDTSGAANPLTVIMTRNRGITATFAINTYTLAVSSVGNGAVAKSPDLAAYDHGASVTLTPQPAAGHHFVAWSGDTSGVANPMIVVVTRNRSITATFAINTYTLALTPTGNGGVLKSPDQPAYDHGVSVSLSATPAVGHSFAGWGGDTSGVANPMLVVMTRNRSITATFVINTYTLSVTPVGNGSVAKVPSLPAYDHGTSVQLVANPNPGHHLVSWSGAASGSVSPTSVLMDGPKSVTATFAINTYALSVTTVGLGAVSKSPDLPAYDHGTMVTLTATPEAHYHFNGWSGDASGAVNPLAVLLDAAKSVTATFALDEFTLSIFAGSGGKVAATPNLPSYPWGTQVTLEAQPDSGFAFDGWSGDVTGSDTVIVLNVTANRTIVASFVDGLSPAVDVTAPNGGEVLQVGATYRILYRAADNHGVASVNLTLSRNGVSGPFEPLATGVAPTGMFDWVVTGPPTANAMVVVTAHDSSGNVDIDFSDQVFTISSGPLAAEETPITEFALTSVGPNPSRGRTWVEYTVARASAVRVSVLDIQGREIAVIAEGTHSTGRFRVAWDARAAGSRVAPGAYFVRYKAPGKDVVRRVLVTP